ncbi:MlaA family lipoprotein [Campylobacter sp.]|uniref:MlaA family lipoprotein n=1 Tax=Campylobacter sp. TaxID=205 RepID=UPI00270940DB|nr:VacJ family lipoprotein [Campylobacter sp.]
MKFIISLMLAFTVVFASEVDEFDDEFKDKSEVFDPLSGYNRVMTNVNDFLYVNIFNPAIRGYNYVVPQPVREMGGNFFDNLMFPIRFVNNLLQFKFKEAGEETLRFVVNTIIGFGGLTDGAKYYDLQRHDEDFGQTLGYWGVGSGFHIVLPILGPSNLRDMFGLAGDYFTNPITYVEPQSTSAGIKVYHRANSMSLDPDAYERLKKDAVDLYPFLRDAYEQRRNYLIKE